MDVSGFLAAVVADWVGLMSGAASILLTIIGFSKAVHQQRRLFWIAGALCFFLASVRIWTTEHRALLAEMDKNRPNVTVDLFEVGIGPWIEDKSFLSAYFIGAVKNLGAQTAVSDYEIELTVEGKPYKGQNTTFNTPFVLTDMKGRCNGELNPIDFLPQKTMAQPVGKNSRAVGWLAARFPDLKTADVKSNFAPIIKITARDIYGNIIVASEPKGKRSNDAMGDHYYVGMTLPTNKPVGCAQ